jgi:phosphinothricin acetyltransferase
MTIAIRPVRPDDAPAITRIYAAAVEQGTASFELDPPEQQEIERRMRDLVDHGFPYIVAEIDGRIAGYAYAGLYRTRLAYRFTLEDSVYVAPQMQGHGVGRALLDRLITESTERGFRQIVAVIGDSTRQAASIRLHQAAGFQHVGILQNVGYKFGAWLDSVLMQRALGERPTAPP